MQNDYPRSGCCDTSSRVDRDGNTRWNLMNRPVNCKQNYKPGCTQARVHLIRSPASSPTHNETLIIKRTFYGQIANENHTTSISQQFLEFSIINF